MLLKPPSAPFLPSRENPLPTSPSFISQLFLRMRQPRLIGPNNVVLAYPRKLASLSVNTWPIIDMGRTIDKAEKRKQVRPVQKFHQAWHRAVQQELLGSGDIQSEEQSETVERSSPAPSATDGMEGVAGSFEEGEGEEADANSFQKGLEAAALKPKELRRGVFPIDHGVHNSKSNTALGRSPRDSDV